jgi:hypothetical protein
MRRRKNRTNRRGRQEGHNLPLRLAGCVVLGAATGLAHVELWSRASTLNGEIKVLERQLADAEQQRMNEESRWVQMKAPHNLEAALARHHIAMAYPRPDQIVRIETAEKRGRELAGVGHEGGPAYPRRARPVMHE